jgi:hypothetical protein
MQGILSLYTMLQFAMALGRTFLVRLDVKALLLQPLQRCHDKLSKLEDAVEQHHPSNCHTYEALHDTLFFTQKSSHV